MNGRAWCSQNGEKSGGCNIRCKDLLDDDITDDIKCATQIVSLEGLDAWGITDCLPIAKVIAEECLINEGKSIDISKTKEAMNLQNFPLLTTTESEKQLAKEKFVEFEVEYESRNSYDNYQTYTLLDGSKDSLIKEVSADDEDEIPSCDDYYHDEIPNVPMPKETTKNTTLLKEETSVEKIVEIFTDKNVTIETTTLSSLNNIPNSESKGVKDLSDWLKNILKQSSLKNSAKIQSEPISSETENEFTLVKVENPVKNIVAILMNKIDSMQTTEDEESFSKLDGKLKMFHPRIQNFFMININSKDNN